MHPFPAGLTSVIEETDRDHRGRIWLVPHEHEKSVALFQPETGQWRTFASLNAALRAETASAAPAGPVRMRAAFSKSGKIAYATNPHEVRTFDGKRWRDWSWDEFRGEQHTTPRSRPFFDMENRVCVNFEKTTRRLSTTKWEDAPLLPAPAEAAPERESIAAPRACGIARPDSAARATMPDVSG